MARVFLPLLHAVFAAGLAVRDGPATPVCKNGMWCPSQDPSGNLVVVTQQAPSRDGGPLPELMCAYPMYFNTWMNQEIYQACDYDITTGIDLNIDNPNEREGECQKTLACRPDTYTPAPASAGACYVGCPASSLTAVPLYDVWHEGDFLECVYPWAPDLPAWLHCRYDTVTGVANEWNYGAGCPEAATHVCPTSTSTTAASTSSVSTSTASVSTTTPPGATTTTVTSSTTPSSTSAAAPLPTFWSPAVNCAVDSSTRVLVSPAYYKLANNTPFACATQCGSKGYQLAGVEYGDECYCAHAYTGGAPPASVPAAQCNRPCAGDASLTCGAGWRMQVYASAAPVRSTLPAGWTLAQACAQDGSRRAFAGAVQAVLADNSPAACTAHCASLNATLAGTEYGDECWCGTGYTNNTPPPVLNTSNCSYACSGASDLTCGGSWALQIYAYAPS